MVTKLVKLILVVATAFVYGGAIANTRTFQPDMAESKWEIAPFSLLECKLSQKIPSYGEAVFVQRAGKQPILEIKTILGSEKRGFGLLTSTPPPWSMATIEKSNGRFKVNPGKNSIKLSYKQTRWVLAELQQGWQPTLEHVDWDGSVDSTILKLSAINFKPAMKQYVECLNQLLSYGYDDVKEIRIGYRSGSHMLSLKDTELLNRIIRYIEVDKSVKKIILRGYSDNSGTRRQNYLISINRLREIESYFAQAGVDSKMIDATAYGERNPAASNRTKSGRALNRRVTIHLLK